MIRETSENPSPYYTGFASNGSRSSDRPSDRMSGRSPDVPLRIAEHDLIDEPLADSDDDYSDGGALARRILVAFVLIGVMWVVFVMLLAQHVPPILPAAMSAVIMIGALLTAPESASKTETSELDNARPIGCCQGPRPLGEASRKAQGRGSCGCG